MPPLPAPNNNDHDRRTKRCRGSSSSSCLWICTLVLCAVNVSSSEAYLHPPFKSFLMRQRGAETALSSASAASSASFNSSHRTRTQRRNSSRTTTTTTTTTTPMTTSILGVTLEKPRFFFATKVSESFAHGATTATTATTAAAAAATTHHDTTATTEPTIRSMWRRRNARSAEEGIRREKTSQPEQVVRQKKTSQLSSLLAKVRSLETKSKQYAARTISGLINALAEEVDDLDVQVDARRDTPMSGKHVDAIRIKFSRLVFKPLRMGGLDHAFSGVDEVTDGMGVDTITRQLADLSCADEAFQRIDVDRSGALDPDEIATALNLAAGSTDQIDERKNNVIKDLASQLVQLYDFNGDGVVDRSEYQSMVEDMAALRKKTKKEKDIKSIDTAAGQEQSDGDEGWLASTKHWVLGFFQRNSEDMAVEDTEQKNVVIGVADNGLADTADESDAILDVSDSVQVMDTMAKTLGSITLSDLKIDLRRLIFGAVPILKHITPGGPLILEPFTTTVTGSFSREDMLNSFLLDAGLRRLVARALRRRVRSFRDLIDGAVFFGRSWKMTSASAPVVEIPQIENIEFDDDNRLIITGRAQVQTRSDAPQIENAFKVRTRIGTRKGGRTIKLIEPELAFILECPESWEKNIATLHGVFGLKPPARPKPIFSFFPIYSPFKQDEDDGFDLGEDNRIQSIFVRDGALRFEMSAVLRPGRFLGNHYLAFTIPNRTFIITLDRVKEGMKAARKMKQAARALEHASLKENDENDLKPIFTTLPEYPVMLTTKNGSTQPATTTTTQQQTAPRVAPKSFFSRFVDGYLQAEREEESERFTTAISDWFGRQGSSSDNDGGDEMSNNNKNE